jgi:DNA mismatch repair ATPase MutL
MSAEKLAENIAQIAKNAVPKMPHKWSNVQNICIKTAESVALPIYNKTPELLREVAKLAGFVEEIDTPETDEVPKDENETVNDKKRDLKSPLHRALKKQKQEEKKKSQEKKAQEEEKKQKKDEDKPVEKETPKQKKRRASSEGSKEDAEQASPAKKKKGETPESTKKAVKKQKEVNTPTKEDTKPTSQAKKKKVGTPESTKKAVKKESKTPESTKKATRKPESETKKKDADDDGKKKEFIATKKFDGSKKGYVFKMGKQGVGYYIDAKPVVDRMAMEAIARLGKGNGKGGQKKNKKGGRRSF